MNWVLSGPGILFCGSRRTRPLMKASTLCSLRVPGFTSPARDYQWAMVNINGPKPLLLPQSVASSASLSLNKANHLSIYSPPPRMHKYFLKLSKISSCSSQTHLWVGQQPSWDIHSFCLLLQLFVVNLYSAEAVGRHHTVAAVNGAFWENEDDDSQFSRSFQSWGPQIELVSVKRWGEQPHSQCCHVTWPWSRPWVSWVLQRLSFMSSQALAPCVTTSSRGSLEHRGSHTCSGGRVPGRHSILCGNLWATDLFNSEQLSSVTLLNDIPSGFSSQQVLADTGIAAHTHKYTHKLLTMEERPLVNTVCVSVCACMRTHALMRMTERREREKDREREIEVGKTSLLWMCPRVVGTALGTPGFWRSQVWKHQKMAEPEGPSGGLVSVICSSHSMQCHSSEPQLLLCNREGLCWQLSWSSSSFSLLIFPSKLVGQGGEGFG